MKVDKWKMLYILFGVGMFTSLTLVSCDNDTKKETPVIDTSNYSRMKKIWQEHTAKDFAYFTQKAGYHKINTWNCVYVLDSVHNKTLSLDTTFTDTVVCQLFSLKPDATDKSDNEYILVETYPFSMQPQVSVFYCNTDKNVVFKKYCNLLSQMAGATNSDETTFKSTEQKGVGSDFKFFDNATQMETYLLGLQDIDIVKELNSSVTESNRLISLKYTNSISKNESTDIMYYINAKDTVIYFGDGGIFFPEESDYLIKLIFNPNIDHYNFFTRNNNRTYR